MKINLIGYILNGAATRDNLGDLILRDDGTPVTDPEEALDILFREYVNARDGEGSDLVHVPQRFKSTEKRKLGGDQHE